MEIKLNKEETKQVIETALCNGLGWIAGYDIAYQVDNLYSEAKERLKEKYSADRLICKEDILMEILNHGEKLIFDDRYQEQIVSFTLEEAQERLKHELATKHIMDILSENDDAISADVILQVCMFNDVVYG